MTRPNVVLPPLAAPVDQLWHVLLDLADGLTAPWTLIGGQMVLLHALENGQVPPQISQDGDVVADVRASPQALKDVVAALTDAGFTAADLSTDGLAHRYERPAQPKPVVVDVLGPEGLAADTPLLRTTPPGRTVQVPGGTQALERTEHVDVTHEGRIGTLPRPSLLGAMVLKGAAVDVDPHPARHLRDLALLCALVEDPFAMREALTSKDRKRLRRAHALHQRSDPAWALVPPDIRGRGQAAFTVLTAD